MDVERERRFNGLVLAALEVEPAERSSRLRELAEDDPDLVAEVLQHLEDHLHDFLESPAAVDVHRSEIELSEPRHVGPYLLGESLGVGGMGEVFRATQEEPIRRNVALKLVRAHLVGRARRRFLVEQRALARLNHSNIAKFYEAGAAEDGRPWFAMELIDGGEPLTTFCDRNRLSLRRRLELFRDVCAGVEHVHQNQILHRDLKPSNILVREEDGKPLVKVIDFGISKALDSAAGEGASLHTRTGLLGTPAYMSPEALSALDRDFHVDTRTDVYSLGVVLFELLTGEPPFDDAHLDLVELIHRRRNQEPETPSRRLSKLNASGTRTVARGRSTSQSELMRSIQRDLDWIVIKAMAPDRNRRYSSAGELAADIERFLGHEPVQARPPTAAYHISKLLRRHRSLAAGLTIAGVGIVVGGVGLGLGWMEARQETQRAQDALAEAREVSSFLTDLFKNADPNRVEDVTARELLDRGAREIPARFADRPTARGRFLQTIGDVYVQMADFERAEPMLEEARDLLQKASTTDDLASAKIHRSFGVLHTGKGDWSRAEEAFRKALEELDPARAPEVWASINHNLGVVLFRRNELEEAELRIRDALAVRQRSLHSDHPDLGNSYNALGAIFMARNSPGEAIAFLQQAAEHQERILGPEHPHLAKSLINLANARYQSGQKEGAIELARQVEAIQKKSLGPDHPDLITVYSRLRRWLTAEGDVEGAIAAAQGLSATRARRHGRQSTPYARALISVADLYLLMDDLDNAESTYSEAERLYRRNLPENHISQMIPKLGHGAVAWRRGQLEQAEVTFRRVLERREAHYGPDHRSLAYPLRGLAGIHVERGEPKAAEPLFCRALELYVKHGGPVGIWEERLRSDYAEHLRKTHRASRVSAILEHRASCSPSVD